MGVECQYLPLWVGVENFCFINGFSGRIQNMDRGPWTTRWYLKFNLWGRDPKATRPWTGSMGWSMDQVNGVVHGPRSMFCIRPDFLTREG